MSPEEVQEVLHRQVHSSTLEIASDRPIHPNHHEVYVQSICGALLGSEWYRCSFNEQKAKENTIQEEYERMLAQYLPVLQQFQRETNKILKPDKTFLANLFRKPIDEELLKDKAIESRDQAARKRLGPRYWTYEQYRPDLVQRRKDAPAPECEPLDFITIPVNEDGKTKTCPTCEKKINRNSVNRHFRTMHCVDPRNAIFCPRCPLCGPVFVVWRGDSYNIDVHLQLTHDTVLSKKEGKADKDKDKDKDRDEQQIISEDGEQEAEYAEQAEDVQGDDPFEAIDEEVMPDDEMFDDEMSVWEF